MLACPRPALRPPKTRGRFQKVLTMGRLGVYGLILGRLPLRVFSIGKYAFQKKVLTVTSRSDLGVLGLPHGPLLFLF